MVVPDHPPYLLTKRMMMNLHQKSLHKSRQKKRRSVAMRYDTETIPQEYRVTVTNRFAALLRVAEEGQTPNEVW